MIMTCDYEAGYLNYVRTKIMSPIENDYAFLARPAMPAVNIQPEGH
jgi:hypothetical protein